jgi:hypothetical protein
MNDYQARRQAKADRLRGFAQSARRRAEQASATAQHIADITQGEPVKLGHHSAPRHMRDLDRMWSAMGKSAEEQERAARNERRAAAVENDTSISRYDPEAVQQLEAKIAELEAQAERYRFVNAELRRRVKTKVTNAEDAMSVTLLQDWLTDAEKADLMTTARYQFTASRPLGYPAYALSNLNGNLRRYKERLKEVQAFQGRQNALEVVNTSHSKGLSSYELDNGWYIVRDRSRRNEAQYMVRNERGEQQGDWLWTWRLALDAAERLSAPAQAPDA